MSDQKHLLTSSLLLYACASCYLHTNRNYGLVDAGRNRKYAFTSCTSTSAALQGSLDNVALLPPRESKGTPRLVV